MTEPTNLTEAEIQRFIHEQITVVPYNPEWPAMFEAERDLLCSILPADLIGRIEHFGSTAVPGLAAKPIIDMLVEVTDLAPVREIVAPMMQNRGYDYVWRPSGMRSLPYYAIFFKRNQRGERSHQIHMVEAHFQHWDRLKFRDYLRANPKEAAEYVKLKYGLAAKFPTNRGGYYTGKGDFVNSIMASLGCAPPPE